MLTVKAPQTCVQGEALPVVLTLASALLLLGELSRLSTHLVMSGDVSSFLLGTAPSFLPLPAGTQCNDRAINFFFPCPETQN